MARASKVVSIATKQPTPAKNPAAVALGRMGGLKGGNARAASMTPERRKEIAQRAAKQRWANRKSGCQRSSSAQSTATQVGRMVRNIMTKNGGTPPERLAVAEDITGVKKRLKSANREMKKMDGKLKPRALPVPPSN